MKDNTLKAIETVTVIIVVSLAIGCLFALPVKWLWNWIAVDLFHAPAITWAQAWGLSMLCSFLFKSGTASTKSSK